MAITSTSMTDDQRLAMIHAQAPRDLVVSMESLRETLGSYVDIAQQPARIFDDNVSKLAIDFAMEGVEESLDKFQYEDGAAIYMETMTGDLSDPSVPMSMRDAHAHNLRQLMVNSVMEARAANANQRNLNELTPFDAFLPFAIIRSYLPLVMKDIVPYVVPAKDFIRLKWSYKYVVTKDNQTYLRPDVYNDPATIRKILDSAKGKRVTDEWYPKGTVTGNEGADTGDYEIDGKHYNLPTDGIKLQAFDLLGESGGIATSGDQLDKDICVFGARAKVKNNAGTYHIVEVTGIKAYPDLTSISPQRSVSFTVDYPVPGTDGGVESTVTDRIFGTYNDRTSTFDLVSLTGATKQIQFGGHLSNKTNTEYISYTSDFRVEQHPISEGYRFNAPITPEDMHLYNQTASIEIVANAVNEATEMFTEFEDGEVLDTLNSEYDRWVGKGTSHPFVHFQKGPVVFKREVSVKYNASSQLLKRNQFVQDTIQYNLDRMIQDIQGTTQNEPYRVILFAHPAIASLFVGDNIDWKIQPGTSISEGIRTDYNMGIYTAGGSNLRLVTSLKFDKADGVRLLILPVNEENFLSWKHFKYSMYFDRDHRTSEMPNVPNVMAIARYQTQPYVPLQGKLIITDYDK